MKNIIQSTVSPNTRELCDHRSYMVTSHLAVVSWLLSAVKLISISKALQDLKQLHSCKY